MPVVAARTTSDAGTRRMTTDQHAIAIDDVRKVYPRRVVALDSVAMHVRSGEIFGLLGPNGAGKSTLVKIMMTVVRPTHAVGTVLGARIGDKPTLGRIGYLPEHHRFPPYLTARQAIDLFGAMSGAPRAARRRRTAELLEIVRMSEWADRRIGSYSKGMRQRVGIAAALVHDPALVVLDEPTDGVDPVGRREIRDVLVHMREQGRTVFLNSHLLSELEMVCDRVAILVQGRVWAQGTIDDLTAESRRYEIVVEGELSPLAADASGVAATRLRVQDGRTRIVVAGADAASIQPLLDRLRRDGRTVVSMVPVRESLEDLFMRAVEDPNTGSSRRPGAPIPQSTAAAGSAEAKGAKTQ